MGVWKSIFPLYLSHWPIEALKITSLINCEELFNYKQQLPSPSSCIIKHNKLEEENKGSAYFLKKHLKFFGALWKKFLVGEKKPNISTDITLKYKKKKAPDFAIYLLFSILIEVNDQLWKLLFHVS